MSAELTGGFDSCLELASSFIDLQAEPAVAGAVQQLQDLRLPLVPAPGGPALAGTVRLLFSRADVLPAGDFDDGRVTLRLLGTLGIQVTAPATDRLALAAHVSIGALAVTVSPPATRDGGMTQSSFALDLSSFDVRVEALPLSAADLAAMAARLGLSADAVTASLAETLRSSLAAYVAATSPASSLFPIPGSALQFARPGQDGRLGQDASMIFLTDVSLATRADTRQHPAVLCVLSDLFDRPAPVGSTQAKTAVATGPDGSGAVIVTADAAQRFVLCPSILRALLPIYLNQVLQSDVLRGIRPEDVPGFTSSDTDLGKALQDGQIGSFFDQVLPGGLPPVSYRSALGDVVWGRLRPGIQIFLSDTDAAMAEILPSQCGSSGGMPMPYSKLTSIQAGLIAGYITLRGVIEPDLWGVAGRISFSATLFASVDFGGTISLVSGPPKIDSTIHLEWYAVVLGAIAGAILGALAGLSGGLTAVGAGALAGAVAGTIFTVTAAQDFLAKYAANAVTYQLGQTLQGLAAPALPLPAGTVPTAIGVTPDDMTVWFGLAAGAPTRPPPLAEPVPSLYMSVQTVTAERSPAGAGTAEIDNSCVHDSFSYQDYAITTMATFTVQPSGLTAPVSYQWTVDGTPVGAAEYGQLTAADASYNMLYTFTPDRTLMNLLNMPGSPTVSRLVRCVATDADGISADAGRGAVFVGAERDIDPAYGEQLARCLTALVHHLKHISEQPVQASGTGPVSGRDLAGLISSLTPGGEWDPRASGLLSAALHLAGDEAAAAREALTLAGQAARASLEP